VPIDVALDDPPETPVLIDPLGVLIGAPPTKEPPLLVVPGVDDVVCAITADTDRTLSKRASRVKRIDISLKKALTSRCGLFNR
jgi:hypothetical protein